MNLKLVLKIVIVLCLLALPAAAAEGDITSLRGIIGDPLAAFNGLDASTKSTIQWGLAMLVVALAICVTYGVVIGMGKTAVGSGSKDAKMSTSGITSLIMIGATILIGVIILGVSYSLITGIRN